MIHGNVKVDKFPWRATMNFWHNLKPWNISKETESALLNVAWYGGTLSYGKAVRKSWTIGKEWTVVAQNSVRSLIETKLTAFDKLEKVYESSRINRRQFISQYYVKINGTLDQNRNSLPLGRHSTSFFVGILFKTNKSPKGKTLSPYLHYKCRNGHCRHF